MLDYLCRSLKRLHLHFYTASANPIHPHFTFYDDYFILCPSQILLLGGQHMNYNFANQPTTDTIFHNFYYELSYLPQNAWAALHDIIPMTQKMFDYIQLRRMEIGPELDRIAMNAFLKYPEYATNYSDRLEKAFSLPDSSENPLESIRQKILDMFDYDIGL